MRTGGSSVAIRKTHVDSTDADSGKLAVVRHTPPGRRSSLPSETEASSADDTHRGPARDRRERTVPIPPSATPPAPTTLLIALSVALVLALLGIVILLLRK
jgi:serine/threonine-protein kinase